MARNLGTELTRWNAEDYAKMKLIERAIIDTILPLVQNINPLLALFALVRCARVMLRKGDADAQKALLPVVQAYLAGKTAPPGEQSILWLPPGMRN